MQLPGSTKIMKVYFDAEFYRQYKRVDVRIQKSVDEQIRIFRKNPMDPQLNNHSLQPYQGYRSIDITADYRALYEEVTIGEDTIAYFETLGTHEELYEKETNGA